MTVDLNPEPGSDADPSLAGPQEPDALAELILDQSMAGVAVPVMLSGPEPGRPFAAGSEPYSTEAYVAQCRSGLEVIEGRARARSGILALQFHELQAEHRDEALRRLEALAQVGPSWAPPGPDSSPPGGVEVFVGFYDGYRETALWGAEVCDRLGLRAFFFPIFTGTEPGEAGLSDADLTELAQRHEIGFHTDSHLLITEIHPGNAAAEVSGPIERIRAATGRPPAIGAWCGGTRFDPAQVGNQVLAAAGIPYLLSNWSIEAVPATPR